MNYARNWWGEVTRGRGVMGEGILNKLKTWFQGLFSAPFSPEERYGLALVGAMALTAIADGELQTQEMTVVEKIMGETEAIKKYLTIEVARQVFFNFTNELTRLMEEEQTRFDVAISLLIQEIPRVEKKEWKLNILEIATRIALADGTLHPREEAVLDQIARALWDLQLIPPIMR